MHVELSNSQCRPTTFNFHTPLKKNIDVEQKPKSTVSNQQPINGLSEAEKRNFSAIGSNTLVSAQMVVVYSGIEKTQNVPTSKQQICTKLKSKFPENDIRHFFVPKSVLLYENLMQSCDENEIFKVVESSLGGYRYMSVKPAENSDTDISFIFDQVRENLKIRL